METNDTAKFRLHAGGDILGVIWDGNIWVAPCCGAQYAHQSDAMRQEVAAYLRACGDDIDDIDALVLADYGDWIEAD